MSAPAAPPQPRPVDEALAIVSRATLGLLALGMPRCAACMLLPTSLAEIRRARPELTVAIGEFSTPADWQQRERLLWPRGIRVSRSSVPALALLAQGVVIAGRSGGGPAEAIDRWLESELGPAARPLEGGPTPAETAALGAIAGRIRRQESMRGRG